MRTPSYPVAMINPCDLIPGDIVGNPDDGPLFAVLGDPVSISASGDLIDLWVQLYNGIRVSITICGCIDVMGHVEGSPSDPHGGHGIQHWDSYDAIQAEMKRIHHAGR